jgi:outer membrane protein assembly factor BamD (BamD/ComL family)
MTVAVWSILLLLSAEPQQASAKELYYQALQEVRTGSAQQAFELLQRILNEHPEDAFADDALIEQARIAEEVLEQPVRALDLYRALVEKYPDSRLVRRAKKRIEFLGGHLDAGEEVLKEYLNIQRESVNAPAAQTVERMSRLLDGHREFSLRPDGLHWLGSLMAREGMRAEARARLEEAIREYPEHEVAGLALGLLGNMALEDGDLDGAAAVYLRLAESSSLKWRRSAQDALKRVDKLRWRKRVVVASVGLWVLGFLGVWTLWFIRLRSKKLRLRWIPPAEAIGYLVIMVGLIAWAATGTRQTTRALLWMAGMVFLILVPNGWLLRSWTPRGGWMVLWVLGLVVICGAAIVAAIGLAGMTRQVLHTLQFGTD